MVGDAIPRRILRAAAIAPAALLAAGAVAGCGSAGSRAVSSAALFATHCGACHSLTGSSTPRQQGGDLKRLRLPRSELLQFTAEMPVMHGPLTPRELRAVVSFLQSVERRRRG